MFINGNVGVVWLFYLLCVDIKVIVVMLKDVFVIIWNECVVVGVDFYLVDGFISDVGKIVGEVIKVWGFYDVFMFKELYWIEGKKIMGLEIVE